jgi:hypothetical protein
MTALDQRLTDVDRVLDGGTASVAVETEWIEADSGYPFSPALARRGRLVPVRTVMYLTRLSDGQKLRNPLKVEISPTDDLGFDVYAPALNLGGVGESLDGAVQDLEGTLLALRSEYFGSPSESLASDALALVQRLRTVFLAPE